MMDYTIVFLDSNGDGQLNKRELFTFTDFDGIYQFILPAGFFLAIVWNLEGKGTLTLELANTQEFILQ